MGKRRVIAETGAGQHGVAAATACALLGLECVVYMGTEDMRRQRPNVERMGLLGAEVAPVEAGARTLKEAVSAAIRDWVANVATTHYIIGSAVGPAPYPALVRDLQRVIGDEIREQAQAAEGRLPDRVVACVGGGSNAIGAFAPFVHDERRRADRRGGGGGGAGRAAATRRRSPPARAACCTARCPRCSRTSDGQVLEAHSVSAGLDYPGVGPRARLAARRGPGALRGGGRRGRRSRPSASSRELEGIIPALEPAHALAWLLANPSDGPRRAGALGPRRQGPGRGARPMSSAVPQRVTAIGSPRRSPATAGRAALMPYLMGGHPDLETSLAACDGGRRRRRRPDRARRAVLRPAGRRPGDPRGRHRGAGGGRHARRRAAPCARRCADACPVVLMVYANVVLAAGAGGVRASARRRAGASGLIVPDLPHDESGELRAACDARGHRAGAARGAHHARRSGSRRSARTRAASSTPCR